MGIVCQFSKVENLLLLLAQVPRQLYDVEGRILEVRIQLTTLKVIGVEQEPLTLSSTFH
jgi:hypothetical protein